VRAPRVSVLALTSCDLFLCDIASDRKSNASVSSSGPPSSHLCVSLPCFPFCRGHFHPSCRLHSTCSRSPRRAAPLPFSKFRASYSLLRCAQLSVSVCCYIWIYFLVP